MMAMREIYPKRTERLLVGGVCCALIAGCGETPPAPPPADAAVTDIARPPDATDAAVTDIAVTDMAVIDRATQDLTITDVAMTDMAVTDATEDPVAAIGRLLDDPSAALRPRDEPADPRAMAFMARVPARRTFGATPDADGNLADPLEGGPLARPFLMGRPHIFGLRIDALGAPSATPVHLVGAIASAQGIVLPRRVRDLEAGDLFRPRTALPGALSRVDFDITLADTDDQDSLEAHVLLLDRADTTLTLTLGAQSVTVDTANPGMNPRVVSFDDGSAVAVHIARDPQGHCLNTRALVGTITHLGPQGPVGELFGVLHRGPEHIGWVRGVFGRAPTSGRERVLFRAVDPAGHSLWAGRSESGLAESPRVGLLTDPMGRQAGTFRTRRGEGSEAAAARPGAVPLSFEIHTECR